MIRKTTAILLGIGALFFLGGLLIAPPSWGPAVILGLLASAMAAGAAMLWPRGYRFHLPPDLTSEQIEELPGYSGPIPSRFGRSAILGDLAGKLNLR